MGVKHTEGGVGLATTAANDDGEVDMIPTSMWLVSNPLAMLTNARACWEGVGGCGCGFE